MIYAYTGKTGSGKTFAMVHDAFKEWRNGRDIYSNTLLFFDRFKKNYPAWYPRRLRRSYGKIYYYEDINELVEVRDGIILIDEAQVLFNARNWENLPFEFQYKLQQHRKHKLDLYATMQNMGTIDIAYRRLVQKWYHFYDVFAILGIRNPNFMSFHTRHHKDVDMLYNTVDDLNVESLKKNLFIIGRFRSKLYDTLYDIGFDRLKTIWLNFYNSEKETNERKVWIIPKQMQLKDVLRLKSSYQSALGLRTLRTLKNN